MKICQLCAVDFTLYHFLLPLMRAMREAGHEVVGVCAPGTLVEPVRAAGFRVETVPFDRSFDLAAHARAYRAVSGLFARERFDLVHVHTPIASLIARLAAARRGVPRVAYTAHGFYFHDRMNPLAYALFAGLEWVGGRFTDILFTQAEEDAGTARRLRLCRGGAIEAIGNGSDPARFHPAADAAERASLRAELGLAPDRVAIACVARLVAEKGYPELFEAMRTVDADLLVVGDRLASDHAGSIADRIAAVERDPVLGRRIRFLGYRRDVPALLRAADIFVLASHREGMPRSIIEAMLSGLPVVATDIRGAREEVRREETGLIVPVLDPAALGAALARLVAEPATRERFGAAGLARARDLYDERKVVARQLARLGLVR
ncbi:MAG: glycosyltransferase family 4 protein [Alphaproteobacteria bacterium]|nr:glycosyltransferase family 4 protein [Alphaproteobacteria bacterium]